MPHKIRVLAVVGPTAGGKSDLAMALAQYLPIEIVCMDSMQIYQRMDIGTAKPTPEDRARVAHHMLDVCTPHQAYSVAEYVEAADAAIAGIVVRGHVPVLVGGTGLYLRALRYPMTLGGGARDDAVRARYQQMLEKEGAQAVHALLHQRDPEAARTLHPNNTRRVIRALEVLEVTGQLFSSQRMPEEHEERYDMTVLGTQWPRPTLYERINLRVERMMQAGLVEEVRALLDSGVSPDAQSMQGLGYKEVIPYLAGQATREDTVELISRRTRNYAKRQLTWFNREPGLIWIDMKSQPQKEWAARIAARWHDEH
ncbi:MAG: tRNA (adenosine(37)-N6)-dimethylallyltransferase MiaA [Christensenellales bacterium]|jgi:tRNA dimethylallyltransferase